VASRKTKQKNKGKANRADLAKRQSQRLERRLDPAAAAAASSLEIRPIVGPSERIEDAAVFNRDQRSKLAEEMQLEAAKVNESLELTHLGQFENALAKLKDIARSSPFSDWRLFVRGLHAFYEGDFETARQNWIKLEATRRPARIASTLLLAETGQPLSDAITSAQKDLVEHAQTLRLRKHVVTAAEAIAKVRHRDPEVTFSVSQFAMLSNFVSSFRKLDPEFVSRVGQACVGLSIKQGDMDVFDRLKKLVPGPADDPNWNRTQSMYMIDFEDAEELMLKASRAYIEQDLPKLSGMPDPLKNALSSQIYLRLAAAEGERLDDESSFGFSFGPSTVDYKGVHSLLRQAIKCYPTYRLPHEKLIASLKKEYDRNDRSRNGTKGAATRLEKEILAAKEAMVRALPDEVEISLELIDLYLDEDELEKANALVKNLSGQRLEDPLAKALPWKLKLKEAMRLSRRKADLAMASKALDEAELLWPVWLHKNWLPFLKAGLALRGGDQANFEKLTNEAKESQKTSPLVGNLMAFAALQQMNIPGPDLKIFRTGVEPQLEKADALELSDLFSIGSFFWDLARTGFNHKGYRMQASKVGKAFVNKLKTFTKEDLSPVQLDAYSWGAHHKFWPSGNEPLPNPELLHRALKEPRLAAAILGWLNELSRIPRTRIKDYVPLIAITKEAARTEKDAFYRYQFDKVSDGFNAIFQEQNAQEERRGSYGSTFNDDDDDDEDDYDDDDDEYDVEELEDAFGPVDDSDEELCDCSDCRADRARAAKLFEKELRTQPKAIADVFAKLGPDGIAKLNQFIEQNKPPEEFLKAIGKLFPNYDISPNEMIEFVMLMTNRGDAFDEDSSSGTDPDAIAVEQSIDELKAARKRREKELERKNREASRSRR